jgi:hypothetical protein
MQTSEPEPQDVDPANTEQQQQEEEDYYMEDDCDDADGYDEDEYEFDGAGFNQHLADKFYGMDLPPGVEAASGRGGHCAVAAENCTRGRRRRAI